MKPADVHEVPTVVERREGRSGELVLRRRGASWEVILNGAFLIASVNEASSRALVSAASPFLQERPLDVLIGGLGMGYALDEAAKLDAVQRIVVAEYEPAIVEWFERYFDGQAPRRSRGARPSTAGLSIPDTSVEIVVADVTDVLRDSPAAFDLIALDTDNGPAWLVRDDNAGIYDHAGIGLVRQALRPGGVAVFWSPEAYGWFEERLRAVFASVILHRAHDRVHDRLLEYTMYVCRP